MGVRQWMISKNYHGKMRCGDIWRFQLSVMITLLDSYVEESWKGQTIATFYQDLLIKGPISKKRRTIKHLYSLLSLEEYKRRSPSVLDKMYEGSVKNFLVTLYDEKIPSDELNELKKWFSDKVGLIMNEWLKVLIALSVGGSGVLLLSILITYVTKGSLSAKWSYLSLETDSLLFPCSSIYDTWTTFQFQKSKYRYILWESVCTSEHTIFIIDICQILFAIWVVGVFITSVWSFYSYKSFIKKMKIASFLVPEESKVQHLLNKNMVRMNISAEIKLVYSHCNISPFLIGILKTFIVLPMYKIPNDELVWLLSMNWPTLRKKICLVNRAMLIATILHWYNPLVYLLQKEMHVWCELSCDEEVVMKMSHIERKKYGETILNMIERRRQAI